uniref:Serpin domain-containing protein n=1 Tax=Anguilla anguilla TaxID=7936 RepID=A0A0E9X6G5_ANGAN
MRAQSQLNDFMEKTSPWKTKLLFQDINSTSDLLFASSMHFKGKWRTMFRPEATSLQEFWIDDKTSVTVPLMTHKGIYSYLDDKRRKCTVLKLPLSRHAYMLLVLPYEGAQMDTIEDKLTVHISEWTQHLKEGLLEVSLPKLSLNVVNDLQSILTNLGLPSLLGTGANFSHLSRKENFTVGEVLNEVVFETSEEGSEQQDEPKGAEAAMKLTVNRPFCFAIVEESSSALLLLGRIGNPVK